MVPTVHENELGTLAVRVILGLVPLQVETAGALETTGKGLTVTVMVNVVPVQPPVMDTGVMRYWTVPAVELPGFVRTWWIADPDPAEAPEIPPVIVPIVQVKLLEALAVRVIFGSAPLHTDTVAGDVTTGTGLTVTMIEYGDPVQEPVDEVGVTRYCTDPAAE